MHDFAQSLDLEIDTSRKKHIHKTPPTTALQVPLSSLWTKLHKLIIPSVTSIKHEIAPSAINLQLLVVTVRPE